MTDIKKGDRVKVTFEGEVSEVSPVTGRVRVATTDHDHGYTGSFGWVESSAVEKIEPPVEVFKPGDILRSKETGTLRSPLREGGWVNLTTGEVYRSSVPARMTSEGYEKVSIE